MMSTVVKIYRINFSVGRKEHRAGRRASASAAAEVARARTFRRQPGARTAQQYARHGAAAHPRRRRRRGAARQRTGRYAPPPAFAHPAAHGAQGRGAPAPRRLPVRARPRAERQQQRASAPPVGALGALGRVWAQPRLPRLVRPLPRAAQGRQVGGAGAPPAPRARHQGALPLLLEHLVFQWQGLVVPPPAAPSAKPHRVTVHLS